MTTTLAAEIVDNILDELLNQREIGEELTFMYVQERDVFEDLKQMLVEKVDLVLDRIELPL